MNDSSILAIDFGTTNSYFCKCPADQISPVGVDFGSGRDGIPTAILYRREKDPLVGNPALHEYGESSNEQRANYTLCTQFKPDVTTSEEAAKNAEDFLRTVVEQSQKQHIVLDPARHEVIVGVPAEAGEAFRTRLREIAKAAGYGNVKLLDEPKGALLSHLWHKDFSPEEAVKGVLIVDFGGGTCDFAFLRSLDEIHSWGDMELGGRLFDDLFFRWFLDQNAAALRQIENAGDTYYVHSYLCREAKEFFSLTMARDRTESVNKSIGRYGSVRNMNWETFLDKAKAYKPSPAFVDYLRGIGVDSDRLTRPAEPLDLIEWFRKSLAQGLVEDVVSETLGLDPSKLMRSDRPYAVIAEGLAILSPLQRQFEKTRSKIREELSEFCRTKVRPLVQKTTDAYVSDVATDITLELFDKRISPVLQEFRDSGGSIASLKKSVSSTAKSSEPELRKIVDDRMQTLRMGLPEQVRNVLTTWIESHGLSIGDARIEQGSEITIGGDAIGSGTPDLYGGVMDTVGWFVVGIATSIGAILCGGTGTAILVSGPIGLIGGAVLALVIAYLTVRHGKEKAAKLAENWDAPAWVIKRALTKPKIHKAREAFRSQLEETLRQETMTLQDEFETRIRKITEMQIEGLSEIAQL